MTGADDVSYEAMQIRKLGSLENGGTIKLRTGEGGTHAMGISPDKLKLIAAIITGQQETPAEILRTVPCNCEQIRHETGELHPYLGVPAGTRRANYVGRVCDDCAETCMANELVVAE